MEEVDENKQVGVEYEFFLWMKMTEKEMGVCVCMGALWKHLNG